MNIPVSSKYSNGMRKAIATLSKRSQPMALTAARPMTTIGEQLNKKERVEEDRFVKALEEKQLAKIRQQIMEAEAAENAVRQKELHKTYVAPVMVQVEMVLEGSGDKLSNEGLEKIARWKLGMN